MNIKNQMEMKSTYSSNESAKHKCWSSRAEFSEDTSWAVPAEEQAGDDRWKPSNQIPGMYCHFPFALQHCMWNTHREEVIWLLFISQTHAYFSTNVKASPVVWTERMVCCDTRLSRLRIQITDRAASKSWPRSTYRHKFLLRVTAQNLIRLW